MKNAKDPFVKAVQNGRQLALKVLLYIISFRLVQILFMVLQVQQMVNYHVLQ